MSDSFYDSVREGEALRIETLTEFEDVLIPCMDCPAEFIWTAGEQVFFRDKALLNPPKRCKACKQAKNKRLEAIEIKRLTGKKIRIEIAANCAKCSCETTVPFYPCQGRPVYCRACFNKMNPEKANCSNGTH